MIRILKKVMLSIKHNGLKKTVKKIIIRLSKPKSASKAATYKSAILSEQTLLMQSKQVFDKPVKISVLVPLYNTDSSYLIPMIESVLNQSYANWELCLADASDKQHSDVEAICKRYADRDARIVYRRLETNKGISGNTNEAAAAATGDYFALLDHDDTYMPDALFEIVKAINETDAQVLYTDEDKITIDGVRERPFYKPDFSQDLLYSQMYICHLFVVSRRLYFEVNGLDSTLDGSQDYDLMLRLSERTNKIVHIPKVLYSWREIPTSTAINPQAKPYAQTAGIKALDQHLNRMYAQDAFAEETDYLFVYQARFRTLSNHPLISIIIPTKDHIDLLNNCVCSIIEKTAYPNYEIIILDNNSTKASTFKWFNDIQRQYSNIKVIEANMEFNWSKLNNLGIHHANGEVFVFLNNDTVVITENWLELLAENALRKDIGAVGALLLYEDDTIQHAGVVLGMGGWADHVYKGVSAVHMGKSFISPVINRNVLAVTGACMAISRQTIDRIGTFNENFIICGSDVEMCLRAYNSGLRNLLCAHARLYHLESKSRDSFIPAVDFEMSEKYYSPYREQGDPFYNPNLDLNHTTPTVIYQGAVE